MKPPLLRVSMIWGRETIRLQSDSPVIVHSSGQRRDSFPSGQLEFKILSSHPAASQTWLWLGFAKEGDLSGIMTRALDSNGWTTGLWPVGLNPSADEWGVRDYRLLARLQDGGLNKEALLERWRQIEPNQPAEVVELPWGQAKGTVSVHGDERQVEMALPITLATEGTITVPEALVGEGFHWEHTEALRLTPPVWVALGADGKLCAGVEVEVEDYLASVNSSEMPADSPPEFLKSQVVAARSWLLANWGSHHPGEPYTICNGDHCQCYFGSDRVREGSRRAAEETSGEVLRHNGRICDARYAKSCGGVMEPAANVWAFADEPYLGHFRDLPETASLDLSEESAFRQFQTRLEREDACCSPGFAPLEGRLKELAGLYRWQEKTTLHELGEIIQIKTSRDLGKIKALRQIRRGPSGRLIELEVSGSTGRMTLTPELAIRKALSRTHLPSSAFWIESQGEEVILHGLGWGHGVGLCQIGAAALAIKGWDYRRILAHYYRGAELAKVY